MDGEPGQINIWPCSVASRRPPRPSHRRPEPQNRPSPSSQLDLQSAQVEGPPSSCRPLPLSNCCAGRFHRARPGHLTQTHVAPRDWDKRASMHLFRVCGSVLPADMGHHSPVQWPPHGIRGGQSSIVHLLMHLLAVWCLSLRHCERIQHLFRLLFWPHHSFTQPHLKRSYIGWRLGTIN